MEASLSVQIDVTTKSKGSVVSTKKTKNFSRTLFIPQMFNRENLGLYTKFYPTQQKFATLTDIDAATLKMNFPSDYVANETYNKAVCDYFLEIFRHIESSERSLLLKLKVIKKSIQCTSLIASLFERNDFRLFESILKVATL